MTRHIQLLVLALISGFLPPFSSMVGAAPIPPEVKAVVAFLFAQKSDTEMVPWGTAFFVGVKHPKQPERSFVYLVTAKHVLQTPDRKSWLPKIFIRLNRHDGGSDLLELPIVISGKGQTTFVHPDPTVDLAVIPAVPDEKVIDFKFLPDDMITTKEDFRNLRIVEGSEVFFTGLFSPYIGTRRNYPVVRFGRVALITEEKIKFGDREAELYLIKSGAYGGNSGAPVFFYLGSEREPGVIFAGPPIVKLAGVISGTFLDMQPVRAVETATVPVAPSNMGIAGVVPAYKLYELLFASELKALREK